MKTRYLFLLLAGMWLMPACLSAQGTWTQKANYAGIERWGAVSFSIGDKGYIVTGARYDGGWYNCQKDLWEYDPVTNIWSQKADFGGVGRYLGTGFSIGTKGYVGWGLTSPFSYINDFWEYNSITNVWTQKADLGSSGSREDAVGFSIGSKGYMGTGCNHNLGYGTSLKDFWEYDPSSDNWTKKNDFGGVTRASAVGFSIGTKGYIGTGGGTGGLLPDFWEYNPGTDSWIQKASFGGVARFAAVGFSIGSKGYIGTGTTEDQNYGKLKDFWEYSPENDNWVQKADFGGGARSYATGFSIGTKGYIGCGRLNGEEPTKDFWEFDAYCTTGPAGQISGNSIVCAGQNSEVYSVPVISNATNYIWLYSGTGATINGYGNSVTINFAANATSGTLTVFGTGSCGNGQVSPDFPITIEVGGWSQKADYAGIPRWDPVSFSIGTKGYIVTGAKYNGGAYTRDKDLWEFDPTTNIWSQKADFGGEGRFAGIGFSIGTKGYVGFGLIGSFYYATDFWEYNSITNAWTKKADLGETGSREGAVGFSIGSKGYMGTGASHNLGYGTRLKDFYEYDPATNIWTKKADFGGAARCAAVGFAVGSKGYIGTGNDEAGTSFKDFWEYNPTNNSWTKKADFGGVARISAAAFSIGSKGYIGTGHPYDTGYGKLKDFWEYSPQNNTWTKKADFGGNERSNATGFSIGTRGYIGCGNINGQEQTNDFWEFTSCEVTGVAGPIAGATSVCVGESGVVYGIPAITGATAYYWSYSGTGATINGTGNSITIDFATNATGGMLSVSVTDNSGAIFIAPDFPITIAVGGWSQKADYAGIPRWGAVSFSIGTKGYIVTGAKYDGGAYTRHKDLWEFDPTTNIWSQKADFGGEGRFAGIGFSIGTKGYVGFGLIGSFYYATDFWEYDATTNVWTKKADLGETGSREGAVGFSIGSKGYMGTGGSHNQGYGTRLKDFYEYNPATDVWTKKADFGGDARCAAVGFAIGTKGYIGTGNDAGDNSFKDFWEYDPSTNNWTKKADFGGVARISAVAFSIGSKGYFGTGQPYNTVNGKLKDFWEYSPENNTWTQKADFGGGARSYATGFSIGTKGYIGCGNLNGEEQTNDFWEFTSCEVTGIAGPIAGATSVCIGESGVVYSIPAITGATAYAWSYSGTGATINGTGNSITIDFATNATGGMLSVSVTDNSGAVLVAPDFAIEISEGGWVQKSDYAGIPRWDPVSFSIGTKGYIVTGVKYDGGAYTRHKDLWEFDPTTNIWSQKADFGGEGRFTGIGFSIGTKGYVGFGLIGSFYYATDFWEYDAITNVWTKKADLGETGSRESAVAFSIGSKGYMGTGASHNLGYGTRLKDFYEYDPATDVWTKKADFGGAARCAAVGFAVGSKGYIGTGNNEAGTSFKDFWEYNPTNNSWTKKADFGGVARISATAFSIGSKGYIGTGHPYDTGYGKLKDFWEYTPENNTWTQKADFGGIERSNATGFSIGTKGYIGCGKINGQEQTNDFWEFTSCEVTGVAGPIAGATSVCVGESDVAYSIPAITGATAYAWSYSGTGATINGTGNAISIDFSANATGGMLSVSVTDNSGAILVAPDFPIAISEGGWTQKANYAGIPRWDAVSFSIGTKGYIVTGARYEGGWYNCQKDLWEFDPTTNIWSQKADFGGAGRYAGTGFSIGSKGYVGWGLTSPFNYINDFWEYDAITNVWTKKADLGETGSRDGAVGFSIGSKGYMGTGASHNLGYGTRLKDFYEYDPATNVWTKKADFGGAARCAAVGFAVGAKGYIGTGNNAAGTSFKDFWEYNPATNTWSKKADFGGVARISAAAFSIGSKGYIGTGATEDQNYGKLKDFWEYSPENDTWLQKTDFGGNAKSNGTGFSIGNKGYIGCGNFSGQVQTNDFWEYMPDCTIEDFTVTIEIPGAFTPNDDNINDYFAISFRNIKTADVWIKDQWGVLITKFDGVNEQWDGLTESGREAPSAPYFYIVSAIDFSGMTHEKAGVVYLIRDLVELYPNPAIKSLNVETNGRIPGERNVKIYSSKGDLMLESKTTSDKFDFDVSQFMPGIYFVHISNGTEESITKFIKQ
jgi:gliding motility-associated-like protein